MKKRAAFLIGTGCILLTASLALAVNNQLESVQAEKSAATLSEAFLSDTTVYETPVTEVTGIPEQPGDSAGSETSGAPGQMPVKAVTIDGQEYIGLLSIPSLGLSLPVNNNISYPLMRATPCRYYGDEESGSLIIAAHNYNSHFGRIGTLKPGDEVTYTDASGKTVVYSVSEIQTLPGSAVDEMIKPGDWDLTLFTCNYSGTERVTVRCVKEDRL